MLRRSASYIHHTSYSFLSYTIHIVSHRNRSFCRSSQHTSPAAELLSHDLPSTSRGVHGFQRHLHASHTPKDRFCIMVPVFLWYLDHSFRIFGEGGGYASHNIESRSTLATYAWRAPLQPASSRQNECPMWPMWYNRQPVKLEKPTHAQSQPVLASGALVSLVGLVPILCDFLGSCHAKGKLHICEFHEFHM